MAVAKVAVDGGAGCCCLLLPLLLLLLSVVLLAWVLVVVLMIEARMPNNHVPAFQTESQESAVMANHTMAAVTSRDLGGGLVGLGVWAIRV